MADTAVRIRFTGFAEQEYFWFTSNEGRFMLEKTDEYFEKRLPSYDGNMRTEREGADYTVKVAKGER